MGRPFKLQAEHETALTQIVESDPTATLEEIGAELLRRTRAEGESANVGVVTQPHGVCVPA